MRKTAGSRFRRTLRNIREWGWKHRHLPMREQQCRLNEMLRGHDAYYGITGNYRMLQRLRWEVAKMWRKWLARRNRGKSPNWEKFNAMLRVFPLTPPALYTLECNEPTTPEEPYALIGLVRFCEGRRLALGPGGPIREELLKQRWEQTPS